jgi:predicted ribosome quality control (RQC) complex YloA/Tae2 family protein
VKSSMTASDIYVMLREARDAVVGRWILNIYQVNGTLLFKISQDSPNKTWLLIEPGRRMHLTSITYEREARQRAFCQTLRKHLRDHKVTALDQHDFDRVVYLRAGTPGDQYTLVVELFGDGNAVLLDPNDRIITAMTYRRMRDRDVVRGAPFQFPPLRAKDPLTATKEDQDALLDSSDSDVVRTLVSGYNMSGSTAEEILTRAGIKFTTPADSLQPAQRQILHDAMRAYFDSLSTGQLDPCIVMDVNGNPLDVLPISSPLHETAEKKGYTTFNAALDSFFSIEHFEKAINHVEAQFQHERAKLEDLLQKQKSHYEDMEAQAAQSRLAATTIYQGLPLIDELLATVRDARKRNLPWREIEARLALGKAKGIPAATIFQRLEPQSGRLLVAINGQSLELDIRLSGAKNAEQLFRRSKQLEKKVAGAQMAVEDTTKKLVELSSKQEEERMQTRARTPVERRKKRWFEKFRWFETSGGVLVLGGQDAASNQQLVRKYLEVGDLFFHADVLGAPVVVAKTAGSKPTSDELQEIAVFAVSYSRAWKAGWTVCDAYWVPSSQVSFSAPAGEYLAKGSVMVRGERNYMRGVPVRLAVGLMEEKGMPFLAAGPQTAISRRAKLYVSLAPGDTKASDTAKILRRHFASLAPSEMKEKIEAISIDEIVAILPPGLAKIEKPDGEPVAKL